MLAFFIKGMLVSGSLIIAIGSQNAFVLKQGLLKQYVPAVVIICFLCDFLLISIGVLGLGSVITQYPILAMILSALGGCFLVWYGWLSFKRAWCVHDALQAAQGDSSPSLRTVIISTLAVTLLNPHVYLDTLVIIGGLAASLSWQQKIFFTAGALLMSALWFISLGFGSRLLRPWFQNPRNWQILECIIGAVMWWIAYGLFAYIYHNLTI